jgi:hypothetical protein
MTGRPNASPDAPRKGHDMKTASDEKFVVYWLGYHQNPPAI